MSTNFELPSLFVDGLPFPPHRYTEESVRSAQNYRPRDDDVIVVTYPKSGTTWTQVILSLIFSKGDPVGSKRMFASSPFLELKGSKEAETMARPGIIKTHLPFGRAPWSDKAKYIFVSRNPKDCCVSYFHHYKLRNYSLEFDQFFEMFIKGTVNFGDYFDHLMSWEKQRNKNNILFITYEEMKEDTKTAIFKMATFIDDEKYAEPLRQNEDILNNILKYSTPEQTKEIIRSPEHQDHSKLDECHDKNGIKHEHHKIEHESQKNDPDRNKERSQCQNHGGDRLVRKAIIGDWRNYFTEEQSNRMDQKLLEHMKGSNFEEIWKKYM